MLLRNLKSVAMANPPFDLQRAHLWFAVELNNFAWDQLENPARSLEQQERMIHAAHGACFHWLQVGDLLNHLRAQCLLATTYAAAGLGEAAVRHAERCLQLSAEAGERQTPFDRTTAHGCASNAYYCVGQVAQAREHHARAEASAASLVEADEREMYARLYPAILC